MNNTKKQRGVTSCSLADFSQKHAASIDKVEEILVTITEAWVNYTTLYGVKSQNTVIFILIIMLTLHIAFVSKFLMEILSFKASNPLYLTPYLTPK
jgi:hypothetical protein